MEEGKTATDAAPPRAGLGRREPGRESEVGAARGPSVVAIIIETVMAADQPALAIRIGFSASVLTSDTYFDPPHF